MDLVVFVVATLITAGWPAAYVCANQITAAFLLQHKMFIPWQCRVKLGQMGFGFPSMTYNK